MGKIVRKRRKSFLIKEVNLNKTNNDTMNLVSNAGTFLFNSTEYELYGHRIKYVRDPGRFSTIREYLFYDLNNLKDLFLEGWSYLQNSFHHNHNSPEIFV